MFDLFRLPILAACLVFSVGETLNAELPEAKRPTDTYGDALPAGAIGRLGTLRLGSGFDFETIAFSPDGKILASWNADGNIRLWEVASGKELRGLPGLERAPAARLVFSPDGKTLVGGWPKEIWLWDPATGKVLRRIQWLSQTYYGSGHRCLVSLGFSKDGQTLVAAGMEGVATVWDVATGKPLKSWELIGKDKERLNAAVLSANGRTLAMETEQRDGGAKDSARLQVLDVAEKKELCRLPVKTGQRHFYALSSDGKLLVRGEDRDDTDSLLPAAVYETATGKRRHLLTQPEKYHISTMTAFAFSPDNRLLAAYYCDGTLRLWNLSSDKLFSRIDTTVGSGLDFHEIEMAFSPDGKTLALAKRNSIRLFEVATGREFPELQGHRGPPSSLQFSSDGRALTSRSADALCRWDTGTWKEVSRFSLMDILDGHHSAVVSPDGAFMSQDKKQKLIARQLGTGQMIREFQPADAYLGDGRFSPDGKTLALLGFVNDSRVLHLWDASTGKKTGQINLTDYSDLEYALSPDGRTLAWTCKDRTIRLADVATGKTKGRFGKPLPKPDSPYSHDQMLVFSRDGRFLALGEQGIQTGEDADICIRIWETATGRELRQFHGCFGEGFDRKFMGLTFSPDGKTLACGVPRSTFPTPQECIVHLLEMASGKKRRQFVGHRRPVVSLAFSPDGNRLVSGSLDTSILVWDTSLARGQRQDSAAKDLSALWNDLADSDAAPAYQAIGALASSPSETVAFLRQRLGPVSAPDPRRIAQLVVDLDSQSFAQARKGNRRVGKAS